MSLEQRLSALKNTINAKTAECDEIRGRLKQLKEELKKEFDCDNVKDAKQMQEELSLKINELATQQESLLNELETKVAQF